MKSFFNSQLGAEYRGDGRCVFTVWAPFASGVGVRLLDPQPRTVPLSEAGDGYFTGEVESAPPGTRYFFRLYKNADPAGERDDFEEWPDPASRCQPEGVHGPSQVVSPSFGWKAETWRGMPLSKYIVSEIHVGTFTPEGTFEAVVPHLDGLKETGFTAIELMPVAQFPGGRNWGYDGAYPFAVQTTYGGAEGLKRLVDACHAKGLAVVLDVVYNHVGPEGNYFRQFGPYFTDFYKTPWGESVNFDGPGSDHVRRFFIENALFWIAEFRIDALRLDAIHAIYDFSAVPFLEELGMAVRRAAEKSNRIIHCIAESSLNDTRAIRPRELGGFNLDGQWNDDFHHCLHVLLTNDRSGYYVDFNDLNDFAKAWREGYVYSGQYSEFRGRRHGNPSRNIPAEQFVVFAQNHDQVGNRMLGERLGSLVSFERLKLAAGLVLLSPFVPLLFMGDEYGETAPFQYFVSHTDPDLVEAVRKGRAKEFESFKWAGEPPDPQDEKTFLLCKLRHELKKNGSRKILLDFHRKLMELRKKIDSLSLLSKKNMNVHVCEKERIMLVHRWSPIDEAFCVYRFGADSTEAKLSIPKGRWEKILDSWEKKWKGPGAVFPEKLSSDSKAVFNLPPDGLALFFRQRPSFETRKEMRHGG